MNTALGDEQAWLQVGRIVRDRRVALGLTQQQLADLADVVINTVGRLESGVKPKRRSSSWPKIEVALGWPTGFIEDFVTGKVQGPPVPDPDDARFTRQPQTDFIEIIRDTVREVTIKVAPGTPLDVVIEMEERAIARARKAGYVGPPEPPSTAEDV